MTRETTRVEYQFAMLQLGLLQRLTESEREMEMEMRMRLAGDIAVDH